MPKDKHESDEVIICPHCKGYGYLDGSISSYHRVKEVDPLTCPKCQGRMRVEI